MPRALVEGDVLVLTGWVPNKAKKPIGLFDISLCTKDGFFQVASQAKLAAFTPNCPVASRSCRSAP
jgi:hypothetical protein